MDCSEVVLLAGFLALELPLRVNPVSERYDIKGSALLAWRTAANEAYDTNALHVEVARRSDGRLVRLLWRIKDAVLKADR
jgi:hypothetical protein